MVGKIKTAFPSPLPLSMLHQIDADIVRMKDNRHLLRIGAELAVDDLFVVSKFVDIIIAHIEEFL